jgi:hypothetical protein
VATPDEQPIVTVQRDVVPALPPRRELMLIVDPSRSFPRPIMLQTLQSFAEAIRISQPPLPAQGPSAARAPLHIEIREISDKSYGVEGQLLAGDIPGVPAVEALPDTLDDDVAAKAKQIADQRTVAEAAAGTAQAAAEELASQIAELAPEPGPCSDVDGSVSAAAALLGPQGTLIVVSDLHQALCAPNRSGSLKGVRIIAVHYCVDATRCAEEEAAFSDRAEEAGAPPVTYVRPEKVDQALRDAVNGGQS